jgi:hypothetical protein
MFLTRFAIDLLDHFIVNREPDRDEFSSDIHIIINTYAPCESETPCTSILAVFFGKLTVRLSSRKGAAPLHPYERFNKPMMQ